MTGTYYLVRNALTVPSAALGGWPYAMDPELAFTLASVVGVAGTAYVTLFGREFAVYE